MRRAGAALVLLSSVLLLAVPHARPVAARPVQEGPDRAASPQIRLVEQTVSTPADGDFVVWLEVDGAPAGSDLAVDIYDRIETAEDLQASTTDEPDAYLDTFPPLPLEADRQATQTAVFSIPLFTPGGDRPRGGWSYRLSEPGVYPLRLRLRGPDGALLTSVVTYVVREPEADQDVVPAAVSLLADVHADEELYVPGSTPEDATPPVGPSFLRALDRTLAAFADHPRLAASFSVTPRTVERMLQDPASSDTLDALVTELARPGRDLLGAPYVDLDPTALVAAGLQEELVRQADVGNATLSFTLGMPFTDLWALTGPVDAATVGALQSQGVTRLIVPESSLDGAPAGTVVSLPGGAATTLAVGAWPQTLSGDAADPVLEAHQVLARLAASATIDPVGGRTVVRIDPTEVDPDGLATLLTGLQGSSTFLEVRAAHDLFSDTPSAPLAELPDVSDPDLGEYPTRLTEARTLADSWASMVPGRPGDADAIQRALAASAGTGLTVEDRLRRVAAITDELRSRFGAVSAPVRDRVTLGARNARFPLPITSDLDRPVSVVIELEASDRLDLPDEPIEAVLSGERTTVDIPIGSRVTGDTPLRITVRSPDGRVVLAESRYTIRSTAVSGVGVLLTIGAAAFLAVWWGRHWWRTRRDGPRDRRGPRRRPPSPDDGGDPGATTDATPVDDEPLFLDDGEHPGRDDVTALTPDRSNPA